MVVERLNPVTGRATEFAKVLADNTDLIERELRFSPAIQVAANGDVFAASRRDTSHPTGGAIYELPPGQSAPREVARFDVSFQTFSILPDGDFAVVHSAEVRRMDRRGRERPWGTSTLVRRVNEIRPDAAGNLLIAARLPIPASPPDRPPDALVRLDAESGAMSLVRLVPHAGNAHVAVDVDCTILVVTGNERMHRVDPAAGSWTPIGDVGFLLRQIEVVPQPPRTVSDCVLDEVPGLAGMTARVSGEVTVRRGDDEPESEDITLDFTFEADGTWRATDGAFIDWTGRYANRKPWDARHFDLVFDENPLQPPPGETLPTLSIRLVLSRDLRTVRTRGGRSFASDPSGFTGFFKLKTEGPLELVD